MIRTTGFERREFDLGSEPDPSRMARRIECDSSHRAGPSRADVADGPGRCGVYAGYEYDHVLISGTPFDRPAFGRFQLSSEAAVVFVDRVHRVDHDRHCGHDYPCTAKELRRHNDYEDHARNKASKSVYQHALAPPRGL